jgi:hypothetical protein
MKLEDFKSNPTGIRSNLQITGPNSSVSDSETISVESRVVSHDSDVVHTETIKAFSNSVISASAAIGSLQGTTQKIVVSSGGMEGRNCYWLPWGDGKIYIGQLGREHEYFFTYTINGCGFIIGGTHTQPRVAHANLNSKRLNSSADLGAKKLGPKSTLEERTKVYRAVAEEQALTYEQFYGNLAAKLIDTNKLNGPRIEVVTPDQYLIRADAGFGAIFGVKGVGDAWAFYGNWGTVTKQIWP